MRKFLLTLAIVGMAVGVFFAGHIGFSPRVVAAAPAPAPQGGPVISCNSNDGRRNFCPADTRGGVRLVNQRSSSACIFNQTWGFDARNVWVDRGCRADFQASYYGPGIPTFPGYPPGGGGGGGGYSIYCSSDNGRRNYCPTDISGGVALARQRSDSPCIFGSSWGWDRRGVWVDRGCRADFTMGGNNWAPPNRPGVTVVSCSSDDGRRNNCNVNTSRGVRLVRQRSNSDCIYGQSWGYARNFIWVDRGCRADFEVGYGG